MTAHKPRKRRHLPPLGGHPLADTETYRTLVATAHRRTGAIPSELFVRQALACSPGGDWPVQRDALDALLRRFGFCRRDMLRVQSQPSDRRVLGIYETRRGGRRRKDGGETRRPYRTLLLGLDPLETSCDCADFQRSALGLCKHGMAVLDHLAARPRRWTRGLREQSEPVLEVGPRLRWDPIRPLTGRGDWLERAVWLPAPQQGGRQTIAKVEQQAQRCFTANGGGPWFMGAVHPDNPKRRLALVEALQTFLRLEARREQKGSRGGTFPSDPVLWPLLAAERERLAQQVDLQGTRRRVNRALRTLHHPIYPYQREGLDAFLRTGRLLLADDMGLGKTVQAIAAATTLWDMGLVERGLLLVPAALKSQWLREWQSFCDVPAWVVGGSPAARASLYRTTRRGFLIANYELVLRDLAEMRRFAPDIMVLDEAQRIKNWATKTAGRVNQLRPRFRLVLTGTPMENRLEELASIMDWVDSRALEPKWRLVPWHTTAADGSKVITGVRNLNTLRERLAPVMLRRVRQEVLSQLPPRTDTRVPVTFTAAQEAEHAELNQPIAQLMRRTRQRPLTQAEFLKLMQLLTQQRIICNGLAQVHFAELWPTFSTEKRPTPALLQRLDSPKLLELREMITQLVSAQRRKVVIFSQWTRMLRLAQWVMGDVLADAGARSAFFSGNESQRRRTKNIVDFHDDPTLMVLLCSDAGGVGLNLQHAASCLINLDLPWNPAVLEQRIGRIHRLGQKQPIQVYHLISEAGIEARIERTIGVKKALFDGLFDGQSDEIEFDHSASFLNQIKEVIGEELEEESLGQAQDELNELDELDELDELGELDELDELGETAGPSPAEDPPSGAPSKMAMASEGGGSATAGPGDGAPELALGVSRAAEGDTDNGVASDPPGGQLSSSQVQSLLSSMEVRRRADGGVTIEAPPEAAAALAAMFAGMASLISASEPADQR